jgi:hypothetical protein
VRFARARWPPRAIAPSDLSFSLPSLIGQKVRWGAPSYRVASAVPTAIAGPWPSQPQVISTPRDAALGLAGEQTALGAVTAHDLLRVGRATRCERRLQGRRGVALGEQEAVPAVR